MRNLLVGLLLLGGLQAKFLDHPFPAHHVIGNLYYVGSEQLASYLIVTPQGNILINTGLEETVPLIRANVEKLGFHFKDIRILLISHAHFDHCESLATVKAATGAKVYVMQGDADVVSSGGKGAVGGYHPWKQVTVDKVLHDGDTVALGGTTLVAHLTPGHTKGCTTWTLAARQDGKSYPVVIVGSPYVNPGYRLVGKQTYPGMTKDFERTFTVLASLPCDVFLGAHGSYYDMAAKYQRLSNRGPSPFIDPAGYRAFVQETQKEFEQKLKAQTRT